MHTIGRLRIYAVLALALLLHLTVLEHLRICGVRPDLVLASVVFFGFFLGPAAGLETGLVAGAMEDLFALDFFGINIFVLGVTGLFAGALRTKLSRESKRIRALLVFVLTAFAMTLHYLIASAFSGPMHVRYAEYAAASVIPASAYTALVSIPIFLKLADIYGLRRTEEYL